MAKNGANDGDTDGWGNYIGSYLKLTTVNKAIGGRSARSYWNEGRFQAVADLVKSGDIVVIELGHNDGGTPTSNDNGRSDCPGTGTETCISDATGENVYSSNADGTGLTQVTDGGDDETPDWGTHPFAH